MGNPSPKTSHLVKTQWKHGQSGNPSGKPKGSKHVSTWIQELLNDSSFQATIKSPSGSTMKYKGAPIKAIIQTAIIHALQGDKQWAEWLAKYAYRESETRVNIYSQINSTGSRYEL